MTKKTKKREYKHKSFYKEENKYIQLRKSELITKIINPCFELKFFKIAQYFNNYYTSYINIYEYLQASWMTLSNTIIKQLNQLKFINRWPKDKSNPDIGREMWNFTNISNYFNIYQRQQI